MTLIPLTAERRKASPRSRRAGLPISLTMALLAALTCAAKATFAADAAPPAAAPPIEHHAGKFVYVQLVTPDLDAARRFYGGLFGWTFTNSPTGDRHVAQAWLDGRPVAGIVQKSIGDGEKRQPAWLGYMAVADVVAAHKAALAKGAKALSRPHAVGDRGSAEVFSDPQGATFAVLASTDGDQPDEIASPGEWVWSSLLTGNVDTAAGFYQAVLGYDVFELPTQSGIEHVILASDDVARASANTLPADRPKMKPHWLDYVRVDDATATAAKVLALGGTVLVAPRVDRHGGKIAVVADPQGAPFGVMEWADAQGPEVKP